MKARIKDTGEIVTIIAISTEHMTIQCYGNDGIVRLISLSNDDIEIIPDTEKSIDWEQRRYEIAKDAMNGILSAPVVAGVNPNPSAEDIVILSVKLANVLIKELKRGEESK